ncbi:signal transduction histidine kinase [Cryobacterium mesophilum]|uniref:sensor histidine kinase n=1 Tax=Terrimesophilobacter mesophilus TaxID=433647 RepID=UPI001425B2C2|nr:HAMP domain-containing sensor histidine kinase [Terrimesophilobacter mesophilus]MBB5631973.1 signal transduction histidine kinase [Terrimesophilobacter mesophilus]
MLLSRLSIRWRITIGSLVIAVLFFGAGAIVAKNQIASVLSSTAETLLEHDAAPYVIEIRNGAHEVDQPGHAQLVAIIDPAGVLQRTTLPPELAPRLSELERFVGEPREVAAGDGNYLALSTPVATTKGEWTVVTARNLEASALLLDRITGTLVIGALILVIGFGIASWLLTGAALRPVARMRREASELSRSGSLAELPVGPARDELSALATTLNEFIRVQRATAERERQLVSDASHELRSPLAVLMAQLELAHLSSGDAAALEEQLTAAEKSAHRVSELATRLLELSEAEAHVGNETSSWEELVAEVGDAADSARLAGLRSGVTVEFQTTSDGREVRYALDRWGFRRVIDNLTGNATTAMPEGGELTLSLNQRANDVELVIEDDGPGIPAEFLPRVFDRFTRPDESRTASTGGSGLGLAIVHALVASAGGEVSLVNRMPHGVRAAVVIPADPDPEAHAS